MILIWLQRGNEKAVTLIEKENNRSISIITLMELLQCAKNKSQHRIIRSFLKDFNFSILALTENIGHRASIYIEEYSLGDGLRVADSLIAATAVENDAKLISANIKHYTKISELDLKHFKP